MLRFALLPALPMIAGCAATSPAPEPDRAEPQQTAQAAPAAAPIPGLQSARFTEFPAVLLFAAAEACDDPTQSVVRPSRNEVRCETLPAPQAAAALILSYDGTVEDLPRFVIGFRAAPDNGGFIVTAENYIRVPQRSGPARQIRLRDPVIEEGMRELLRAAGGELLPPA